MAEDNEIYLDNENNKPSRLQYIMLWTKRFPVTALIIVISVLLFAGVNYLTMFQDFTFNDALFKLWAGNPYFYWNGQLWKLMINVFHHGNLMHIFFNLYWVYYLGSFAERALGHTRYLLFIVGCGLFQTITGALTIEPLAIGVSGVIYGFFGFLVFIRNRDPLLNQLLTPSLIKVMIAFLFISILLTHFNIINIANVGHFSGFTYGILLGINYYFKPNIFTRLPFILINILIVPGLFYLYKPVYNPEWYLWKATLTENIEQQIDFYEKALSLKTDFLGIEYDLALLYYQKKDLKKAEYFFKKAADNFSNHLKEKPTETKVIKAYLATLDFLIKNGQPKYINEYNKYLKKLKSIDKNAASEFDSI